MPISFLLMPISLFNSRFFEFDMLIYYSILTFLSKVRIVHVISGLLQSFGGG